MNRFIILWFGQVISIIGSGITAFGISVWVYQHTSSVTLFALNGLFKFLPGVLLSPLAGLLADRWPRRRIMIWADSGAALSTLFLALMFFSGHLSLWHVYLATAVNAILGTFQGPAYAAATSMLVPKEQFTRASTMIQLGGSISGIIAPSLAGFLIARIGMPGIMLVDLATFVFAVGTLLLLRFPEPSEPQAATERHALLDETLQGWRFVARHPGLRGLLILTGSNLFLIAVNAVLSIPILLTLTSVEVVGTLASLFSIASLVGSIAIAAWGGPKRQVRSVLGAHLVVGVGLILFGLRPNLTLMTLAGLGISTILPLRDGVTGALWRRKVPLDVQGRVFALQGMVFGLSFGLAYLILGPLADSVFEPLLAVDGPLANSVGRVIGVGKGRGMAMFVVLAGLMTLATTAVAFLSPRVRQAERELPDAL
jgi:MFS family permease